MQHVPLDDQLYQQVQQKAVASGFASVHDYVVDLLQHEVATETETFDQLFTPERLAQIDRAAAEIAAGHFFTTEQTAAELGRRRDAWLRDNQH